MSTRCKSADSSSSSRFSTAFSVVRRREPIVVEGDCREPLLDAAFVLTRSTLATAAYGAQVDDHDTHWVIVQFV